jgi:hypothetical protein
MDSQATLDRRHLLDHLQRLLKASVGGLVVASATVATNSAEASPSSTANRNRPAITQRIEEVRKQLGTAALAAETPDAGPLLAWGNWHNWRNGWPNGWHNWHNWGNWGN